MSDKNKVVVRILGQDYPLMSEDDRDYMQKIAYFVDDRMREIYGANKKLSTTMVAVLTALNIADDYCKQQDENEGMLKQIEMLNKELEYKKLADEKLSGEQSENSNVVESKIIYSEDATENDCVEEVALNEIMSEKLFEEKPIETETIQDQSTEIEAIPNQSIETEVNENIGIDDEDANSLDEDKSKLGDGIKEVTSDEFIFFKQEIEELRLKVEQLSQDVKIKDDEIVKNADLVNALKYKLQSNEQELISAKVELDKSQEELEEFIKEFDQAAN